LRFSRNRGFELFFCDFIKENLEIINPYPKEYNKTKEGFIEKYVKIVKGF
jgi:hypothetical protein